MKLILHEDPVSGNCYKIRLTAALLGTPLERKGYDIIKGETRTPDFLATVNPDGRIPVLQIGERFLPESNAACIWLAEGSPLIPDDHFARANMFRWMFWEQYSHEPAIAVLRFWTAFRGLDTLSPIEHELLPVKRASGVAALRLMERQLAQTPFLAGEAASLADICLYPYTHVAGEGGFDLAAYPAIRSWFKRIEALPGFVEM